MTLPSVRHPRPARPAEPAVGPRGIRKIKFPISRRKPMNQNPFIVLLVAAAASLASAADITGTVTKQQDEGGGAIEGVTVDAISLSTAQKVKTTTTAADGTYTLADLPAPDDYIVAFSKVGYDGASTTVALLPLTLDKKPRSTATCFRTEHIPTRPTMPRTRSRDETDQSIR